MQEKDKLELQTSVREILMFALEQAANFDPDHPIRSAAGTVVRNIGKSFTAASTGLKLRNLINDELDKKYLDELNKKLGFTDYEKNPAIQKEIKDLDSTVTEMKETKGKHEAALAKLNNELTKFDQQTKEKLAVTPKERQAQVSKELAEKRDKLVESNETKKEKIDHDFREAQAGLNGKFKAKYLGICSKFGVKATNFFLQDAVELKAQYNIRNIDEVLKTETFKTILEDQDLWKVLQHNSANVGKLLLKFQPQIEAQLESLTPPAKENPAEGATTTVASTQALRSTPSQSASTTAASLPPATSSGSTSTPTREELEAMLSSFKPREVTGKSLSSSQAARSAATPATLTQAPRPAVKPSPPSAQPVVSSEALGGLIDQLTKREALLAMTKIMAESSQSISTMLADSKPVQAFVDRSLGVDPEFAARVLPTLTEVFKAVQTREHQANLRTVIQGVKPLITGEVGADGKPVQLTPQATREIIVAASAIAFENNGIHPQLSKFLLEKGNPELVIEFAERMKYEQTIKDSTGIDISIPAHKELLRDMIPVVGEMLENPNGARYIQSIVEWANAETSQPVTKVTPAIRSLLVGEKGPKVLSVVPDIISLHRDVLIDIACKNDTVVASLQPYGIDLTKPAEIEAMKPVFSIALDIASGVAASQKIEEQRVLFAGVEQMLMKGSGLTLPEYSAKEIEEARQTIRKKDASLEDNQKAQGVLQVDFERARRERTREIVQIINEAEAITPQQVKDAQKLLEKVADKKSDEYKTLVAAEALKPAEVKDAERVIMISEAAEDISKDDKKEVVAINKKIERGKEVTPEERAKADKVNKVLHDAEAIKPSELKAAEKIMETVLVAEDINAKKAEAEGIVEKVKKANAIDLEQVQEAKEAVASLDRRQAEYNVSVLKTASAALDLLVVDPKLITQVTSLTSPENIKVLQPVLITQVPDLALQYMMYSDADLASKFVRSFINEKSLPVIAAELRDNLPILEKVIGPEKEPLKPEEISKLYTSAITVLQQVSTADFVRNNKDDLTKFAHHLTVVVPDKQIAENGFASRAEFEKFASNFTKVALDTVQTVLTPDNLKEFAKLAQDIKVLASDITPKEKAASLQKVAKCGLDVLKSGVLEKNKPEVIALIDQAGKFSGGLPKSLTGEKVFSILTDPKISEKVGKVVESEKAMESLAKAGDAFKKGKTVAGVRNVVGALTEAIGVRGAIGLAWRVIKEVRKKPPEAAKAKAGERLSTPINENPDMDALDGLAKRGQAKAKSKATSQSSPSSLSTSSDDPVVTSSPSTPSAKNWKAKMKEKFTKKKENEVKR